MNNKIISCTVHDSIELACTFGYQINLDLQDGSSLTGRAITTETSKDKKEYLVINCSDQTRKIELSSIKTMTAASKNPHFDSIHF